MTNKMSILLKIIFSYMALFSLLFIYAAEEFLNFLKDHNIKPSIEELRYGFIGLIVIMILMLFFRNSIYKATQSLKVKTTPLSQKQDESKLAISYDDNKDDYNLNQITNLILGAHAIQKSILDLDISQQDKIILLNKLHVCMQSQTGNAIKDFIEEYQTETNTQEKKTKTQETETKIRETERQIEELSSLVQSVTTNLENSVENVVKSIVSDEIDACKTYYELENKIESLEINPGLKENLLNKLDASKGKLIEPNISNAENKEPTSSETTEKLTLENDQLFKNIEKIIQLEKEIEELSKKVRKIDNRIENLLDKANQLQLDDDIKLFIADTLSNRDLDDDDELHKIVRGDLESGNHKISNL